MKALLIGDSHLDHSSLAKYLKKELKALGYDDVTAAGVTSSTAKLWLDNDNVCRPKKDYCVSKAILPQQPDLLIVSLGTNDLAAAASSGGDQDAKADTIVGQVLQLTRSLNPSKVLWIGPPWFRDNWQWAKNAYAVPLYNAAARANAPIFDSRDATKAAVEAGSGDGVHLGDKGSQAWAKAIAVSLGAKPEAQTQAVGVSPWLVGAALVGAALFLRRKA